jgi:hypothetical protein
MRLLKLPTAALLREQLGTVLTPDEGFRRFLWASAAASSRSFGDIESISGLAADNGLGVMVVMKPLLIMSRSLVC